MTVKKRMQIQNGPREKTSQGTKRPKGQKVTCDFCPWDLMSLRRFVPWYVLSLHQKKGLHISQLNRYRIFVKRLI